MDSIKFVIPDADQLPYHIDITHKITNNRFPLLVIGKSAIESILAIELALTNPKRVRKAVEPIAEPSPKKAREEPPVKRGRGRPRKRTTALEFD